MNQGGSAPCFLGSTADAVEALVGVKYMNRLAEEPPTDESGRERAVLFGLKTADAVGALAGVRYMNRLAAEPLTDESGRERPVPFGLNG